MYLIQDHVSNETNLVKYNQKLQKQVNYQSMHAKHATMLSMLKFDDSISLHFSFFSN